MTWTLDDEGLLTISGQGEMTEFDRDSYEAWRKYNDNVRVVSIDEGVTSIDMYAFYGCSGLMSMTIPASMTTIGFPILFSSCSSFEGIWVSEGNTVYSSDVYGVLFDKEKSVLLNAPGGLSGAYSIPDSVTYIECWAFSGCSGLTSVTIPSNVTVIGYGAFGGCSGLTSVTIPDSVTVINPNLFAGCSGLTSVTIPSNVTVIGFSAFDGCSSLTSVTIPDSVTFIDCWAFEGCSSLTSVTIPASVTCIDEDCFSGCPIEQVFFFGTESDRNNISISTGNDTLNNAEWHYSVSINETEISLHLGYNMDNLNRITLQYEVYPSSMADDILWKTSNANVATVEDGIVTAVSSGTAVITLESNGNIDECVVNVIQHAESINLNLISHTIVEGAGMSLSATVVPADSVEEIQWSSSNTSVVEIRSEPGTGLCAYAARIGNTALTKHATLTAQTENGIIEQWEITVEHNCYIPEDTPATCTETGLRGGKHCQECDIWVEPREIIPALGHQEVIDEAVEPTCTEPGVTEGKHCGRCHEPMKAQEFIPALGHQEVIDEAVDPTCTETGVTEGKHCGRCHEVLVAQQTVAALGHHYILDAAVEPTCTKTGLTSGFHCDVCNEVFVSQTVIPTKEHTLSYHDAVQATCITTGTEAYWSCDICNKLFSDEEGKPEIEEPVEIPMTGHVWEEASYIWSPDNRSLTATHTCIYDNSHTEEETVAVSAAITSPTKNRRGSASYTSDAFITDGFVVKYKNIAIPMLRNMSVMNLPNMLTEIENEAFAGIDCEAIIVPNSCTSIGLQAFANCPNLLYIIVPANVTIDPDAFDGCADVVIDIAAD